MLVGALRRELDAEPAVVEQQAQTEALLAKTRQPMSLAGSPRLYFGNGATLSARALSWVSPCFGRYSVATMFPQTRQTTSPPR
jgi:hypothetical protein